MRRFFAESDTEITDWSLFGYNGLVEVVDAQSFRSKVPNENTPFHLRYRPRLNPRCQLPVGADGHRR